MRAFVFFGWLLATGWATKSPQPPDTSTSTSKRQSPDDDATNTAPHDTVGSSKRSRASLPEINTIQEIHNRFAERQRILTEDWNRETAAKANRMEVRYMPIMSIARQDQLLSTDDWRLLLENYVRGHPTKATAVRGVNRLQTSGTPEGHLFDGSDEARRIMQRFLRAYYPPYVELQDSHPRRAVHVWMQADRPRLVQETATRLRALQVEDRRPGLEALRRDRERLERGIEAMRQDRAQQLAAHIRRLKQLQAYAELHRRQPGFDLKHVLDGRHGEGRDISQEELDRALQLYGEKYQRAKRRKLDRT